MLLHFTHSRAGTHICELHAARIQSSTLSPHAHTHIWSAWAVFSSFAVCFFSWCLSSRSTLIICFYWCFHMCVHPFAGYAAFFNFCFLNYCHLHFKCYLIPLLSAPCCCSLFVQFWFSQLLWYSLHALIFFFLLFYYSWFDVLAKLLFAFTACRLSVVDP